VLGVVNPSWRWEYPTIHVMNFVMYLLTIAAFEYFWRGIPRIESGLPDPILWAFGYSIFLWLTLGYVWIVTPDPCVETILFLIAGLMVRIRSNPEKKYFLWLGIALAFGHFAKAVLFPMAFVFLAVLFVAQAPPKKIAWSAAIFLAILAPQILLLSHAKRHVTFGESGPLTLVWSNWNVPVRNWQAQLAGNGTPSHPTRQVHQHPTVFEFNGPINRQLPPMVRPLLLE
jgi:hypothetical protein